MTINKIIKSTVEEELKIIGATLLSIREAEVYLTKEEREYNFWWWLRSPGIDSNYAVNVCDDGDLNYLGNFVNGVEHCVRPALQIKNLESTNLKIGDIFEICNYEFKIISENLAWMYRQDIGQHMFNEDVEKGNDYETSDVKKFVDEWFGGLINN